MNSTQLALVFEVAVCAIFLIVLLLKLWPELRLDSFRQNMFALRDELFDYAAAGHIGFNDPAYKLLRKSMNGFIRYAHQLTLFRLCFTLMIWHYTREARPFKWSESWDMALKNVHNEEVRNKLTEFQSRSITLIFSQIVTGSPLLIVALFLFVAGMVAHRNWRNIQEVFSRAVSRIGSTLVDARILEEEAAEMVA